MNRDFFDMLSALSDAGADFLIVGAHALAAHGYPRATGDLDILVRPTVANAQRVLAALKEFGAPLVDLTVEDLCRQETVFQIGVRPARIDILTSITGVDFDRAWANKLRIKVEDLVVFCLGRQELIENKKAIGRPKDLADLDLLGED